MLWADQLKATLPAHTEYHLEPTRYRAKVNDPPSMAPPYVSVNGLVHEQIRILERTNRTRENALFPLHLVEGQVRPANGEAGRRFLPSPPEVLSGTLYSCSI